MSIRTLSAAALAVSLLSAPLLAPLAAQATAVSAKPAATAAASARISTDAKARMDAQQKLKTLGDYSGPVNGKRNVAYVTALKSFQSKHHLKANGHLDKATIAAFAA